MTIEPFKHTLTNIDEEVFHFLTTVARKEGVSVNEVLRSMIFGEKMGMSQEAREVLVRREEEHARVDIGPHGGTIPTRDS